MRIRSFASSIIAALLVCGPALCRAQSRAPAVAPAPQTQSKVRGACSTDDGDLALLNAAGNLLANGNFADAAAFLQSKADGQCDSRVDLLLAAAFDGEGDTASAEHTLERAHAIWPADTDLATSLARYYLRDGERAKAAATIAVCRPTAATPERELRLMAIVYLETQQLSRAVSIASLASRGYPSEENLLFLANVLQLQGRYMDVIPLLDKYRAAYADSPPFLITIGESESDGQLYAAAQRDLTRAVSLSPSSYPAHYILGNLLVATGDFDGGIRQYKSAIQIEPRQPRTYFQVGLALEKKDDTQGAQSYFNQALAVDSRYAAAYSEIGKLQLRANRLQPAVENLTRAIQYNPSLQEPYFLLVQAYARLGQKEQSRAVLKQWTAFKKSHPLRPATVSRGQSLSEIQDDQGSQSGSNPE